MISIILLLVGIAAVLIGIIVLKLHPFLSLILAALVVGLLTSSETVYQYAIESGMSQTDALAFADQTIGNRLATAFGNTTAKIGILIAMASIIGTCLFKSGASDRIIRSTLKVFGKKNAPIALLTSGFTLSIPVFFDTVFYLMIPLAKSLGIRFTKKYGLYVMAILAGGSMAHSLIPPTPGPLFVAEEIGIDLGVMILGGMVVGILASFSGYLYAVWANNKWKIPVRDTPDATVEELKQYAEKSDKELPALGISLLPVILPIVLIAGNTIIQATLANSDLANRPEWHESLLSIIATLGDSKIALTVSALFALCLMKVQVKDGKKFKKFIQESLYSGGIIILITSAGGAFGGILQQTNIGTLIEGFATNYQFAILPLAFIITTLIRTTQGSATVAMITAIGVMGGFADPQLLGFHPVYLALAIGCGSKPFPWMNDSGFWIITGMSGMTEMEGIRYISVLLSVMGIVGLMVTMILANVFPLVG